MSQPTSSSAVPVPDAAPPGAREQCLLLRAATSAAAVELAWGEDAAVLAVGSRGDGDVPTAVDVRTPSGELLGTLTAYAPTTLDATLVAASAAALAALAEAERAEGRIFDLEEAVASNEEVLAQAAGQVAHDLNNPLAAISMCLEIARDEVPEGELLASLLDRAAGSADKLKRLVASLDAYGQPAETGVADLAVEVPALLAEFTPLLDETVHVRGDLPTVALTPSEARSVLGQLWENAAKFRRDDVDLEVEVAAEPVRRGWRISVSDNGRGIDAADVERVFAPTSRLDKRVPGLGLGLASVRRTVTRAGGRVGVHSTPGVGTTVWFEVPAADRSDGAEPPAD